ncbi:polysaccharide pyruvyl transferase family protein [Pantoea agglomerans]
MNITSIVQRLKPLFIDETKELSKPIVIQFPVIDICNSRCQMCRIWENKKSNDITVEQLQSGLKSSLFSEVAAIGFNGGEPTLREDLSDIVATCIKALPKLKQISLITNGYKYKQVIEQINKIGALLPGTNIFFDVMVSLDGYGKVHDAVRGRSGNFENAQHVLKHLKKCEFVSNIRIGCTVIKENVYHLHELLEFCIKNKVYIKYRQGVPHKRLYTENLIEPYALTFEEKYEFVEFLEGLIEHYEQSPLQKHFYRSLIGQIIHNAPRAAGCDWKHRGATITARGELAYCAVESKVLMSDISTGDPGKAFFDNQEHLRTIVQNKCDTCHHDYVGIPSPQHYRKIFLENLDKRFNVKNKIKKIPFFSVINEKRNVYKYNKSIINYRQNINDVVSFDDSKINVLICGWYGTETLGDKAIIGGIIQTIKDALGNNVLIHIASLYPYITEMTTRQMVEFKNCKVVTIEQALLLSGKSDFVMFGGGPLMAIDSIAPMQVIFENAKKANAKTIIAGCGVGPLGDARFNNSIKRILELSDERIYRDQKSKKNAIYLGVDAQNDVVAEDPAFTWLKSVNAELKNNALPDEVKEKANSKILLLGLRDFPWKEYAKHLSNDDAIAIKDNYEKVVVESLEILVKENKDIIIKPLPMCTNHFGSDDRWFYRKLFRNCQIPNENIDYSLCGRELEPREYCKEFVQADGLLAMRFHSFVFGLAFDIPSIALDYTLGMGKVQSLAEKYNSQAISLSDITQKELINALKDTLSKNKEVCKGNILDNLTFSLQFKKTLKRYD